MDSPFLIIKVEELLVFTSVIRPRGLQTDKFIGTPSHESWLRFIVSVCSVKDIKEKLEQMTKTVIAFDRSDSTRRLFVVIFWTRVPDSSVLSYLLVVFPQRAGERFVRSCTCYKYIPDFNLRKSK
jgi:hypothetical protein